MKKFLLYGFEPFGKHNTNISQEVLNSIPNRVHIRKHFFKVNFNRRNILNMNFVKCIEEFKPDIIIGLGQYPRGDKIRIETQAKNHMRSKTMHEQEISKNGEAVLPTTYSIKPTQQSIIALDAGKYVCNYSMYKILQYLKGTNIKYAFIHIPKTINLQIATEFVKNIITSENQN